MRISEARNIEKLLEIVTFETWSFPKPVENVMMLLINLFSGILNKNNL